MKIIKSYLRLVCIGILVVLTGCGDVTSLRPLYTDRDLVFDPALVGTWSWSEENSKNSKAMWIFTKGDKKEYNFVTVSDRGEREKYTVHLVKVEGRLFLDIFPEHPHDTSFFRPLHMIVGVDKIKPTLQITILNTPWIENFLNLHPDALRHEKEDTDFIPYLILTAKPKELQAFLIKHEKNIFFEGSMQMIKKHKDMYLLKQPK